MLLTKNAFLVFLFSDRKTAAEGLVQLFLEKEENARREETKAGMNENYFLKKLYMYIPFNIFQKVNFRHSILFISYFLDDFVDDVQKENKAKEKSEESQKKEPKTDKRQEEIVTECKYLYRGYYLYFE